MKCAVCAKCAAEGDVCVEQIFMPFLRERRILENNRIAVQVALRVIVHHSVRYPDHPFGKKFAGCRDVA